MWHHENSYLPIGSRETPEFLARAVIAEPILTIGALLPTSLASSAQASKLPSMAGLEISARESEDSAPRELATDGAPENFDGSNTNPAFDSKLDSAGLYTDKELGDYILLGPLPAGIPINMVTGMNLEKNSIRLSEAIFAFVKASLKIRNGHLKGQAATDAFMAIASPAMIRVAECKDFVVNRGHYFGSQYSQSNKRSGKPGLNDQERAELIDFLKQM